MVADLWTEDLSYKECAMKGIQIGLDDVKDRKVAALPLGIVTLSYRCLLMLRFRRLKVK